MLTFVDDLQFASLAGQPTMETGGLRTTGGGDGDGGNGVGFLAVASFVNSSSFPALCPRLQDLLGCIIFGVRCACSVGANASRMQFGSTACRLARCLFGVPGASSLGVAGECWQLSFRGVWTCGLFGGLPFRTSRPPTCVDDWLKAPQQVSFNLLTHEGQTLTSGAEPAAPHFAHFHFLALSRPPEPPTRSFLQGWLFKIQIHRPECHESLSIGLSGGLDPRNTKRTGENRNTAGMGTGNRLLDCTIGETQKSAVCGPCGRNLPPHDGFTKKLCGRTCGLTK